MVGQARCWPAASTVTSAARSRWAARAAPWPRDAAGRARRLQRAGGPAFALRDYGACSGRPARRRSLFVRIGPVRNRGATAGSTRSAAARPPRRRRPGGAGRGRAPACCGSGAAARGCQRTLDARAAGGWRRAPLACTVRGYDDSGRGGRRGGRARSRSAARRRGPDGATGRRSSRAARRRRAPSSRPERAGLGPRPSRDGDRRREAAAPRSPLLLLLLAARRAAGSGAGRATGGSSSRSRATSAPRASARRAAASRGRDRDAPAPAPLRVTTRYGGGFVQAIDGVGGGRRGRPPGRLVLLRQRDRGLQGAAATQAHARRPGLVGPPRLGRRERVPAVVGSFPEPFLHGSEGKRLPIRLDCAGAAARPATRSRSAARARPA